MIKGINVLSLFDGCSGGQQALDRLDIKVDNYYASEIDKYAIQVTMANYPNTIQLGSVVDVDVTKLEKIDLLCGGSPCQSFSFAGKRKGMSTKDSIEILTLEHYLDLKSQNFEFEGQSYLFWEYMRILTDATPKYFLLENVMMGEKWEKVLSKAIGINALSINSALVSAQNRKRLYWFGQIRERLFYNDNYCYICRYEQENGGIQDKSQAERSCEILGETQKRQINLQNLRIGIFENRKERNDKNLFCYMPREKQKTIRQEQVQNNEKNLSERVSEKEQGKTFGISKELSTDYEGKGVIGKNGREPIKENSEKNENSSSSGINWSKEEAEQRRIDYYSKHGEDMCCVQCGKKLNHRPQTSFVKGWDKLAGKSPSTLSEMQFNEARQNNGRVFDILEIGVVGEDMFGEVINQIPQPKDMGILLKDVLEEQVDDRYYLSDKMTKNIIFFGSENDNIIGHSGSGGQKGSIFNVNGQVGALCATDYKQPKQIICHNTMPRSSKTGKGGTGPLSRDDGKTYCLDTGRTNAIEIKHKYHDEIQKSLLNEKSTTLDASYYKGFGVRSGACRQVASNESRIRRLTPLECERLQCIKDNYTAHVSDTQRYKMIGNGWTISVISHIFSSLKA